MNKNFKLLEKDLLNLASKSKAENSARFFKQAPGGYAQHDTFLGITNPELRRLAKKYKDISFLDIFHLLQSSYNEYRLLALFLLVHRYQKGDVIVKKEVYDFYMRHIIRVNNWNLVDSSAHLILGAHIYHGLDSEDVVCDFAVSKNLWHKRIAIVATWYYIRKNQLKLTLKISKKLLSDDHDLIHKAVGWMLREVGKKDKTILVSFLDENIGQMARTTLRYAIERFDDELRMNYLKMKKI